MDGWMDGFNAYLDGNILGSSPRMIFEDLGRAGNK
jgi:hypothetical protein